MARCAGGVTSSPYSGATAQVTPTDCSDIQALAPRRRLPCLGYLADGGGVGQNIQGVFQGIEVVRGDHDGLAVPVAGDTDPLV